MSIMIDGRAGVAFAQAAARKGALAVEVSTGLSNSRGSILKACRRDYRLQSRSKKGALAEMEALVAGWLDVRTGQVRKTAPEGGVLVQEAYRHGVELFFHYMFEQRQLVTFQSPFEQVKEHVGKTIDSTMLIPPWEYDFDEVGPMYVVWFTDETHISAWPEEIFPVEATKQRTTRPRLRRRS
jgi:3-oxoacyl-ACP reductase-like protein